MFPTLIQPPVVEPVSIPEARQWLRDDGFEEDQIIQTLIVSARMMIEAYTRRFMVEQKWRLTFDRWPDTISSSGFIDLPLSPCRAIDDIRVYDHMNASASLSTNHFRLSASLNDARLIFSTQPPLPGRTSAGIEVDIIVGYGARGTETPEPLRRAILMLVALWREARGDFPQSTLPDEVLRLAAPFRRERLV